MAGLILVLFVACLCQLHALATGSQQRSLWSSKAWTQGKKAHDDLELKVSIALTLRNVDLVTETLRTSSGAGSHQQLTVAEVVDMTSPDEEAVTNVLKWLRMHDIDDTRVAQSSDRGYLHMKLPVIEAKRLLQTDFYHFSSPSSHEMVTFSAYHVPESLVGSIDYISASASIKSAPKKARSESQIPILAGEQVDATAYTNCSRYTSPHCLRDLYHMQNAYHSHVDNALAVYRPAWRSWLPGDLDKFFRLFVPDLKGSRPVKKRVHGRPAGDKSRMQSESAEPVLEIEYAMALTAPQQVIDVKVGDDDEWLGNLELLLAALDAIYCPQLGGLLKPVDCQTLPLPLVLSLSFTWPEGDFSDAFLFRQCTEFARLAALDVTIVASTADWGTAGGPEPGHCIDPVTGVHDDATGIFHASFPASCPWVTAVGGTQLTTQPRRQRGSGTVPTTCSNSSEPALGEATDRDAIETAFHLARDHHTLSSGGGFSNKFLRDPSQGLAIDAYKTREATHLETLAGRYNLLGRGLPDVSAQAHSYLTVTDGDVHVVSGTSASAVVFASIMALIKAERKAVGKAPLLWINPWLYGHPQMFNDITTGANQGCGADPAFRAAEGWDPVTGLGTPDYQKMRDYFMSLP